MKTNILFFVIFEILLTRYSFGQFKELNIGDKIPDIEFNNVLYHPDGKIKLSDFKGKLIILDYWSLGCSDCFAAMPKMDLLQKKFGDKIKIIPVIPWKKFNEKSIRMTDSVWKSTSQLRESSFPTILDTLLYKSFTGFLGVPFEVWISPDGTILGFTGAEFVNEKEINKVLGGEKTDWENTNKIKYDVNKPLLEVASRKGLVKPSKIFYSAITGYLPRVRSYYKTLIDSVEATKKVLIANWNILGLYNAFLPDYYSDIKKAPLGENRTILEIRDLDNYGLGKRKEEYPFYWSRKHTYCYELIVPINTKNAELFEIMRQDLNKFFRLNGRIEKRLTSCLELVKLATENKAHSTNLDQMIKEGPDDFLSDLNSVLTQAKDSGGKSFPPIFISQKLQDAKLPQLKWFINSNGVTLEKIIKELNTYGYSLVPIKKKIDMLVISERSK